MRYPRQQAEVVSLVDSMISGISEHPAIFTHCNAAALQTARNEYALADAALQSYFRANQKNIETWFNIITPKAGGLPLLRKQLSELSKKNWRGIIGS